jgi:hypothetical protein
VFRREEIGCAEVAGRKSEQRFTRDAQPGAAIPEFHPADIGAVTIFLRHDVGHVEVGDGRGVETDGRGGFPIGVIFQRAAAVPAHALGFGGEGQDDTDAGQVGLRIFADFELVGDAD